MNCFTLTAIANLAADPDRVVHGQGGYTRICLVGNDYSGKDAQGRARDVLTRADFVAFDPLGAIIASRARRGDQLMLLAQMRSTTCADPQGALQHEHSFVIQQFRFGAPGRATRAHWAARAGQALVTPF